MSMHCYKLVNVPLVLLRLVVNASSSNLSTEQVVGIISAIYIHKTFCGYYIHSITKLIYPPCECDCDEDSFSQ